MARLKISISLENFKILKFFKIWALRVTRTLVNVGDLRRNSGECQEVLVNIALWVRQTSPSVAKVRVKARARFWHALEPA